jgi:hypothetical protein
MNNQMIQQIALASGFKLKEQQDGTMDLNPYVYDFAREVAAMAIISLDVTDLIRIGLRHANVDELDPSDFQDALNMAAARIKNGG